MEFSLRNLFKHLRRSVWTGILPTFVMLALALILTAITSADTSAAAQADADAIAQTPPGQPICESCHQDTGIIWEKSTHAKTGKVTCESCHGPYKEGHPKAETMLLPMESETCHSCHGEVFAQWEASEHGQKNLDCYDCHNPHTQGLRLDNQNALCTACHSNEDTTLAHSTHGISGVVCDACHMTARMVPGTDGKTETMSDHTFMVPSDVCMRCHSDTVHPDGGSTQAASTPKVSTAAMTVQLNNQRVTELEQELNAAEARNEELRNVAVVGMGLTLGVGGFLGLVIGSAGAALLARRKQHDSSEQ
jgi:hypothetical protein